MTSCEKGRFIDVSYYYYLLGDLPRNFPERTQDKQAKKVLHHLGKLPRNIQEQRQRSTTQEDPTTFWQTTEEHCSPRTGDQNRQSRKVFHHTGQLSRLRNIRERKPRSSTQEGLSLYGPVIEAEEYSRTETKIVNPGRSFIIWASYRG